MPSWVAHAIAGIAVAAPFQTPDETRRFGITAALCTIVPDLDAIGRPFGYEDIELLGGHRGFTHSIVFAVLLGAAVAWGVFHGERSEGMRLRLWICFTLVTLTHGLLDGLTTKGGIMYFSPFTDARYSFAWKPLDSSRYARPTNVLGTIGNLVRGEMTYVILPSMLFIAAVRRLRGPGRKKQPARAR